MWWDVLRAWRLQRRKALSLEPQGAIDQMCSCAVFQAFAIGTSEAVNFESVPTRTGWLQNPRRRRDGIRRRFFTFSPFLCKRRFRRFYWWTSTSCFLPVVFLILYIVMYIPDVWRPSQLWLLPTCLRILRVCLPNMICNIILWYNLTRHEGDHGLPDARR